MVEVDRKTFLASLPVGALAVMSHEDKAEALEHYMEDKLDDMVAAKSGEVSEIMSLEEWEQQEGPRSPRGTGNLFRPREEPFEPMPEKPTLLDFYRLRFAPANHVLQSATHALTTGQPERTILACLLHDVVQNMMKPDHGFWGAQLVAPYVDERVAWAIRYHGALRFYADEANGYDYPEMYNRIWGEDYVPLPYIQEQYEYARNHRWYMESRLVTVNDNYAFNPDAVVNVEVFTDIIGRNWKDPEQGLGYDNSPSAHMWRTIANPNRPL